MTTNIQVDQWLSSPAISRSIYENLPNLFKEIVGMMPNERAKDVLLISCITSIGSVLSNVSGLYGGSRVYPTLFTFIVAPPASDKSAMLHAQTLIEPIHIHLHNVSLMERIEAEALKKENPDDAIDIPAEKVFIMAGNTSASALISQLAHNGGEGILIEVEADTIANSLEQDWGNYSDTLRKAFHHERISQLRVTGGFKEVMEPKLALCISGTPNQAPGIIKSIDDGLSSRFIYYVFKQESKWRDPSSKSKPVDYQSYYNKIGVRLLTYFRKYGAENIEFDFRPYQWKHFNCMMSELLTESEQMDSIVKRLGLITFRLAMIMSMVRAFETGVKSSKIFCSKEDYRNAYKIALVILEHDKLFMEALPNAVHIKNDRQRFLNLVEFDKEYSKSDLETLGAEIAQPRTITKYLKRLVVDKDLIKVKFGVYKRIKPEED